jgi:hypothetical protein
MDIGTFQEFWSAEGTPVEAQAYDATKKFRTGPVRTVLKFGVNNFSIKSSLKQATNEGCSVSRFERGPMCDKCVELDKRIERCRRLSSSLADQITIDRIKALIQELQTQKVELHPEQKS